jgi:hypothetical protein
MSSLRLSPYDILPAKSAELESLDVAIWLRISITAACEHVNFSFLSRTPMKKWLEAEEGRGGVPSYAIVPPARCPRKRLEPSGFKQTSTSGQHV